jgi:hypothetical protein
MPRRSGGLPSQEEVGRILGGAKPVSRPLPDPAVSPGAHSQVAGLSRAAGRPGKGQRGPGRTRGDVAHGSRPGDRGASGPAGWASLGAAGTNDDHTAVNYRYEESLRRLCTVLQA